MPLPYSAVDCKWSDKSQILSATAFLKKLKFSKACHFLGHTSEAFNIHFSKNSPTAYHFEDQIFLERVHCYLSLLHHLHAMLVTDRRLLFQLLFQFTHVVFTQLPSKLAILETTAWLNVYWHCGVFIFFWKQLLLGCESNTWLFLSLSWMRANSVTKVGCWLKKGWGKKYWLLLQPHNHANSMVAARNCHCPCVSHCFRHSTALLTLMEASTPLETHGISFPFSSSQTWYLAYT